MDFEYKVVVTHMRRVLEWKSKAPGEPESPVIWEAPGVGRKIRKGSSSVEISSTLKFLC